MTASPTQEIRIERIGPVSDQFVYEIQLTEPIVSAVQDNDDRFSVEVLFVFAPMLLADRDAGALGELKPLLRLCASLVSENEQRGIEQVLKKLAIVWANSYDHHDLYPGFSASLELGTDVQSPEFSDLIGEHQRYLDVAPKIWANITSISEQVSGSPLKGDALVNFAIAASIDDEDDDDNFGSVVAIGVWLGEQLIAEGGFRWRTLTDSYGECLCVARELSSGRTMFVDPLAVVGKRLDRREKFDARGLVQELLKTE